MPRLHHTSPPCPVTPVLPFPAPLGADKESANFLNYRWSLFSKIEHKPSNEPCKAAAASQTARQGGSGHEEKERVRGRRKRREFDWFRCSIGPAGEADTHLSSTRNGNENSMTAQPKSTPTTICHANPNPPPPTRPCSNPLFLCTTRCLPNEPPKRVSNRLH